MPKFSFIIPVYNVEKYIDRCLKSIENQTLDNYEVIIVDDGATDGSKKIIDKYLTNEKFKYFYQENSGLSEARNTGIKHAKGEYLIFLDSDDYVSLKMCEILNDNLNDSIDIIKFQCKYVYGEEKKEVNDNLEFLDSGNNTLIKLIENQAFLEAAWLYAYKREFWLKNNFKYEKGLYHEDFALTPYILSKANKIKVIKDFLYYYVQVDNSITRNPSYEKTKKKVYDMLKGFEINYKNVNECKDLNESQKKIFNSYLANIVIKKGQELNKEDQKEYYKELKNKKIYDMLLSDSLSRKLKKIILKLNRNIYFKIIGA